VERSVGSERSASGSLWLLLYFAVWFRISTAETVEEISERIRAAEDSGSDGWML
jgi:hypothetical protein